MFNYLCIDLVILRFSPTSRKLQKPLEADKLFWISPELLLFFSVNKLLKFWTHFSSDKNVHQFVATFVR